MGARENKAHRHLAILLVGFVVALVLFAPGALPATTSAGNSFQGGATPLASEKQPGGAGNLSDGAIIADGRTQVRPSSRLSTAEIAPAAAIVSETFEGAWPAPGWEVSDLSTVDGGEYLWGKRNCHPRSGSFGGWSVGGGAQGQALPCSGNYPNNTRSWAVYGPFDLRNATSASLTFHFWGRTELDQQCNFDFLFVGSSTDGTNFSQGISACGNFTNGPAGNGYYQRTIDLNSRLGQRQVWVAFALFSNGSVNDNGITVDDITLDVNSGANPTATPTATNVVPSVTPTATGTATPAPRYTISGTVRNYDGTLLQSVSVTAFGPSGNTALVDANGNYSLSVTAGSYTVRVFSHIVGHPSPPPQTVTVPPSRADINFVFPQPYTIAGKVRDANNVPVLGAIVSIPGPDGLVAVTNAAGDYELTVIAGTYTISAVKPGYPSPPPQTVTVPPSRSNVDFLLSTITATNTPTPGPAPNSSINYLPLIRKDHVPTPMPTATPTSVTPTATPPPASELDGTWKGTTAQGLGISFTIVNRGLKNIDTAYTIGGCGAFAITTFDPPQPITGNTFRVLQPGGYRETIETNGTFESNTAASGTLKVFLSPCGNLDTTWTATKQ